MNIILLTGNAPNQIALANKVKAEFNLVGLIIEQKPGSKRKISLAAIFSKLKDILFYHSISKAWNNLMDYYKSMYPVFPETNTLVVSNINEAAVIGFIQKIKPDLVMVSGTSLIKKPFFQISPHKGIVNLHTGLSPYIKGGPNCTNWCLATGQFHLIGNTIMWLDAGIDSGNIITTEFVTFSGDEDLNTIHVKVMEHAHNLYLRALHLIDKDPARVPSVKQAEICKGNLYLTKMWTHQMKKQLLSNILPGKFKAIINSQKYKKNQQEVFTVALPPVE